MLLVVRQGGGLGGGGAQQGCQQFPDCPGQDSIESFDLDCDVQDGSHDNVDERGEDNGENRKVEVAEKAVRGAHSARGRDKERGRSRWTENLHIHKQWEGQ